MTRLRTVPALFFLAFPLGCIGSDPVGAEPVYWSCRAAAPAQSAADFCPAIGAALDAGLHGRDPARTVRELAPDTGVDPAGLLLVIELVTASDRSLSSRLLWRAAGAPEAAAVAGPVLTLDVADRSLLDRDLRAMFATQISETLLTHGGAPL